MPLRRGKALLEWLGSQFLRRYQGESLTVRTNLHILLAVLLLCTLAVLLTGPTSLAKNNNPAIRALILGAMGFFPLLLWLLRRGHRTWVVAFFTVAVSAVATVPYLIDAGFGFDTLKVNRLSLQILLQVVLISAITEKASLLLLGFSLMAGVLSAQTFLILFPIAGEARSALLSIYLRDLVNLGLATGVLLILQQSFYRAIGQVEAANLTLEAKVKERTEELQQAQRSLVEGERLAVLGRLSASVAHEINTPLGAINSSIQTIRLALPGLLDRVLKVFPQLSAEQEELLVEILKRTMREPRSHGLESRRLQKDMAAVLATWGTNDPTDLAGQLVDAGIHRVSEAWSPLLSGPLATDVVGLISDYTAVLSSSHLVDTATQKAAHYILALRQYYEQSAQLPKVSVDVAANLEEVLTLLEGRRAPGIRVEKVLGLGLQVLGQPARLLQVWDNLITNAFEAMGEEGTLTVTAVRDETFILVTIGDTGPGIPESVRERLFDSFLSKKPLGGTSGIGLGIARAIVAEHDGSLTFESEPGRTRFSVRLPELKRKEPSDGKVV